MIRAGNFHLSGYLPGLLLLLLILAGMVFCERFFCRFLCPMGAVFNLLPILPLFAAKRQIVQRDAVPAPGAVRLSFLCRNPAALL